MMSCLNRDCLLTPCELFYKGYSVFKAEDKAVSNKVMLKPQIRSNITSYKMVGFAHFLESKRRYANHHYLAAFIQLNLLICVRIKNMKNQHCDIQRN